MHSNDSLPNTSTSTISTLPSSSNTNNSHCHLSNCHVNCRSSTPNPTSNNNSYSRTSSRRRSLSIWKNRLLFFFKPSPLRLRSFNKPNRRLHNRYHKLCFIRLTPRLLLLGFLLCVSLSTVLYLFLSIDTDLQLQAQVIQHYVKPYHVTDPSIYHILCTTTLEKIEWGSFLIRCRDLKTWAEKCAPNVQMHLQDHESLAQENESFESKIQYLMKRTRFLRFLSNILPMRILGGEIDTLDDHHDHDSSTPSKLPAEHLTIEPLTHYNATMTIKTELPPHARYGDTYIDIVDNYRTQQTDIPTHVQVIVQNRLHGLDKFTNRKFHVVEHWYNSYPADMFSIKPVFEVPIVRDKVGMNSENPLKFVTVWTNMKEPCPSLGPTHEQNQALSYQCIDETYQIEDWYDKYLLETNKEACSLMNLSCRIRRIWRTKDKDIKDDKDDYIQTTLHNPQLGSGRIYYELFWMYDVLVIPAKLAFKPKLRYGNVQRAVSQMRSGVPVLLEIYGEVLEEFMDLYDYTCAYYNHTRHSSQSNSESGCDSDSAQSQKNSKLWSFEEAVEQMKNVEVRRQCQEEGLKIALDYSPNRIAQKHLRVLGYRGNFTCAAS